MPHAPLAFLRAPVVVSVEHASARVPGALRGLGLPVALLRGHRAYDPGAADVGRALARALRAPVHAGRWSRLVADLNRSAHHPQVVPRRVDGREIPANHLDRAGRAARLASYWSPYRAAVEAELDAAVEAGGRVLHLSVHSFTPHLDGAERDFDVGLLYEPRRAAEREIAWRLRRALEAAGRVVRHNRPYLGRSDGLCSRMRAEHPPARYAGIELELNQRLVATRWGCRALGRDAVAAFRAVLARG